MAFLKLHMARLLVWRAASMADLGLPNTKEASMCKAFAAEALIKACDMLSLYTTARVKPVLRCRSSHIRTTAPLAHVAARWD